MKGQIDTGQLFNGSLPPGDEPLYLGVLVAGEGEPGEAGLAGGDAGPAGGDLDAGGLVVVVGEGDDEGLSADDPGRAGMDRWLVTEKPRMANGSLS